MSDRVGTTLGACRLRVASRLSLVDDAYMKRLRQRERNGTKPRRRPPDQEGLLTASADALLGEGD